MSKQIMKAIGGPTLLLGLPGNDFSYSPRASSTNLLLTSLLLERMSFSAFDSHKDMKHKLCTIPHVQNGWVLRTTAAILPPVLPAKTSVRGLICTARQKKKDNHSTSALPRQCTRQPQTHPSFNQPPIPHTSISSSHLTLKSCFGAVSSHLRCYVNSILGVLMRYPPDFP